MKPLLALAAAALLTQSAERPAWDVSSRWTCQMEKLRICKGFGGACELEDNMASFVIDFEAARFDVRRDPGPFPIDASPDAFSERIVARNFSESMEGLSNTGTSKFVLEGGDGVTLAAAPRADGKHWDAIVGRAQADAQYYFYGTCSPYR